MTGLFTRIPQGFQETGKLEIFFIKLSLLIPGCLYPLNTMKKDGTDKNRSDRKTYGKFPSGLTFMVRLIIA
jgi:hypothetical protein